MSPEDKKAFEELKDKVDALNMTTSHTKRRT